MLKTLLEYKERGLLTSQKHPRLPLLIWNYTAHVQYENLWDSLTLRCRGLVTDTSGNVVNNPIPKFFNYTEERGKEDSSFRTGSKIFNKYDGSLINVFKYKGEVVISSRGSFTSSQCIWATELFEEFEDLVEKDLTYSIELIHPENRIVVDYGTKKELVLLSVRTIKGIQLDIDYHLGSIKKAQTFDVALASKIDLMTLQQSNRYNAEGYVILFGDGNRVKIKFEEYIRLHRIMTVVSTKAIWECVSKGEKVSTLLQHVPDEYFEKIRKYEKSLKKAYIKERAKGIIQSLRYIYIRNNKKLASKIVDNKYKTHIFAYRNGTNIDKYVWKQLKPDYKLL